MSPETVALVVGVAVAGYMAWNIGANDVANAMGTSVGSGALTLAMAVVLAGVFDVDPVMVLMLGMVSALLAAGVWLQIATAFGLPVSTTHSIIGALIGFGLVAVGNAAVDWVTVGQVAASWVVSPVLGGALAAGMFLVVRRLVLRSEDAAAATRRVAPHLVALVVFLLCGELRLQGAPQHRRGLLRGLRPRGQRRGQRGGHRPGAGDLGYKVIRTVGEALTELTPTRGFSAEFGAATTVLIASLLGMPVSTTHTLVGAVIGVGLARGIAALDLRMVWRVVQSWIVTLPVAAAFTGVFYLGLRALLL